MLPFPNSDRYITQDGADFYVALSPTDPHPLIIHAPYQVRDSDLVQAQKVRRWFILHHVTPNGWTVRWNNAQ